MKRYVVTLILIAAALLTTAAYHLSKPNWIMFRKGEGCFSKKEYSQAIPYYVCLLKSGFEAPKLLSHLGTSYLATGDFGKAMTIFENIIIHSPDKLSALKELANIYIIFGRFKEAITLYQTFLQEQPNDTSVRILLARALTWSDRFNEAIVEYRKALGEEQ